MRISPDEFRRLPLEVHALLRDVPLQDVSVIDLPGGGPGRTVADVEAIVSAAGGRSAIGVVRMLVALRRGLGRVFGWDDPRHGITAHAESSYVHRVSDDLARRSVLPVGSLQDGRHMLYALDGEMVNEIRNATVHAFSALVLERVSHGYRFYVAVYVKPIGRLTRYYMALIEPFRRFIVYPSMLRLARRGWIERYAQEIG